MPGAIGLDPPVVESALRELEHIRDQIAAALSLGSYTLASVDVGEWSNAAFSRIENAAEYVNLGRFDLQQTYANVLLADIGISASDFLQALAMPLGDMTLDQLLAALPRAALKAVQDIINKGDDTSISKHELDLVYDKVSALSDKDRAYVLTHLTDEENARLFKNVHSDDWSDGKRAEFYDLYECVSISEKARIGELSPIPYLSMLARAQEHTADDQAAKDALEALRTDDGFMSVTFDQRVALLAQSGNYPSVKSITRLGQLADMEWFQDSGLEDSQRSAKAIAALASKSGDDPEIRATIENTLDWLLDPQSNVALVWAPLGTTDTGADRLGQSDYANRVLTLNSDWVGAGNEGVLGSVSRDDLPMAYAVVYQTVAHEVNHFITIDSAAASGHEVDSYERFMAEYRAWWVGFRAQYGRSPNRLEAAGRFYTQLHSYSSLDGALFNERDRRMVVEFLNEGVSVPDNAPSFKDPDYLEALDAASGTPPSIRPNLNPPRVRDPDDTNTLNGQELVAEQFLRIAGEEELIPYPYSPAPEPVAVPSDPTNNNLLNE